MQKKYLVLDALKEEYPESSRRTFEGWVKAQRVYIGDRVARHLNEEVGSAKVRLGSKPLAPLGSLRVLFQDSDLIVIDKPPGLLSVKSDSGKERTAHDMIKEKIASKVFVVHRLDKETSGVMLFALSESAFKSLKEQFAKRSAGRTYAAVVCGGPKEDAGQWKSYLLDKELIVETTDDPKTGRLAIADYTVLERGKTQSFLKVKLQTGRKNQIRVQAREARCPIVGDKKYGGKAQGRLCLHAARLEFFHPKTNKPMIFTSEIPRALLAPFKKRALLCEAFSKTH